MKMNLGVKKSIVQKMGIKLEQFADDASFAVIEISGELSPPERAWPQNEDGSLRKMVYKKGLLVVDPGKKIVYEGALNELVQ
ncbi:hypothetical protein D3C72_1805380 [compost metagenome]